MGGGGEGAPPLWGGCEVSTSLNGSLVCGKRHSPAHRPLEQLKINICSA